VQGFIEFILNIFLGFVGILDFWWWDNRNSPKQYSNPNIFQTFLLVTILIFIVITFILGLFLLFTGKLRF
jgi:hypothetical protein